MFEGLENLHRVKNGLVRRPANEERDHMIERNVRMQTELSDHLNAVRKAHRELTQKLNYLSKPPNVATAAKPVGSLKADVSNCTTSKTPGSSTPTTWNNQVSSQWWAGKF